MKNNHKHYRSHTHRRMAQRNISASEIEYILDYGEYLNKAGAMFFYLRECDIPEEDQAIDRVQALIGTAVVICPETQDVLTVWRNRDKGWRRIERKRNGSSRTASNWQSYVESLDEFYLN